MVNQAFHFTGYHALYDVLYSINTHTIARVQNDDFHCTLVLHLLNTQVFARSLSQKVLSTRWKSCVPIRMLSVPYRFFLQRRDRVSCPRCSSIFPAVDFCFLSSRILLCNFTSIGFVSYALDIRTK
jgi:hypothetical protein